MDLTPASKLEAMAPVMEHVGNFPFAGPQTFMRFPFSRDLQGVEAAVLGLPLDIATYHRSGARLGPRAVREMSLLVLGELCSSLHYQGRRLVDYGDTWFVPGDLDHAHDQVERDARVILASGARLLSLGGDHSISLPLLRAHAQRHGPLGLIHFDAHTDLYDVWPKPYHGASFAVALQEGLIDPRRCLQLGIRTCSNPAASGPQLPYRDADWVLDHSPSEIADEVRRAVGEGPLYLSFDIDFLDPAYAPGTGTPVIGGPTTNHARRILRLLQGLPVVGADVVELCPPFDSPGQPTALAAASMAFYILELMLA